VGRNEGRGGWWLMGLGGCGFLLRIECLWAYDYRALRC